MEEKRTNRIEINADRCNHCRTCVDACFLNVLKWDREEEKPVVAYPEDCVWCLACEAACPVQCIEVIPAIPGRMPAQF